ncbi:MAG: NB-ARC domain-containing protein [Candidatus Promineifilaceae bacterium]
MNRELSKETVKEVKEALGAWHSANHNGLLTHWLLVQQKLKQHPYVNNDIAILRLATNQVLFAALEQLEQQSPKHAQTLRLRSLDNEVEQMAARQLGVSVPTMYRYQRHATKALTQILIAKEQALYSERITALLGQLPFASYSQLVGVADQQAQLYNKIIQTDAPNFFLVSGIGGIGKTSLIRFVVEQVIRQLTFDNIIWVEIDHHGSGNFSRTGAIKQVLSRLATLANHPNPSELQLKQWFAQQSALLIIDNVEAVDDATAIWQKFKSWTNTSKIILTSRARPVGLQEVYVTSLNEISQNDSLELIRHLAETTGQNDLQSASDAQLLPIFERTGGNPHAIKMVMGLTATRPLQQILDDLPKAKRGETATLYHHIYWRAWRSLSPNAQKLFKAMRWINTQGSTADHIQLLSELDDEAFWQAIEALLVRSLLLQAGTTFAPRYRIHRLSEQFLQEQVLKW